MVDLRGFVEVVDALGGVTVNVPRPSTTRASRRRRGRDVDRARPRGGQPTSGRAHRRSATSAPAGRRATTTGCSGSGARSRRSPARRACRSCCKAFPKLASTMKKYVRTDIPREAASRPDRADHLDRDEPDGRRQLRAADLQPLRRPARDPVGRSCRSPGRPPARREHRDRRRPNRLRIAPGAARVSGSGSSAASAIVHPDDQRATRVARGAAGEQPDAASPVPSASRSAPRSRAGPSAPAGARRRGSTPARSSARAASRSRGRTRGRRP